MKREKKVGPRTLRNTSTDSKGTTFVILKNYASAPRKGKIESKGKERLSPRNKAKREASRNELRKRAGCQTDTKAFEKLIGARIVQEPDFGLLNPSEMD